MRGINNTLEEERKAIKKLLDIVVNIEGALDKDKDKRLLERAENLRGAITIMGNYLQYFYKFNLAMDDPCIDHCCRHATSDSKTQVNGTFPFRDECQHSHDDGARCSHCQMLPNLIKEMTSLLNTAEQKMPSMKHQEMLHDMNNASLAIQEYKHHYKRHHVQSTDHEALFKECIENDRMDGSRVILTIGKLRKGDGLI